MVNITKLNIKSDWTKRHTNCQMSVRGYCHLVQWVLMAAEHCGQYVLATTGTIATSACQRVDQKKIIIVIEKYSTRTCTLDQYLEFQSLLVNEAGLICYNMKL